MAQEIFYGGYRIEGTSFLNEEKTAWIPSATLTPVDGTRKPLESPLTWERVFATQEEADNFALESAQLTIDAQEM